MGHWKELVENYPKESTPKKLIQAVQKADSGVWSSYGYVVPYTVKRDDDLIVVYTDKHTPSAGSEGGCYYINANNLKECVWD